MRIFIQNQRIMLREVRLHSNMCENVLEIAQRLNKTYDNSTELMAIKSTKELFMQSSSFISSEMNSIPK